jgi:hypothetical protein
MARPFSYVSGTTLGLNDEKHKLSRPSACLPKQLNTNGTRSRQKGRVFLLYSFVIVSRLIRANPRKSPSNTSRSVHDPPPVSCAHGRQRAFQWAVRGGNGPFLAAVWWSLDDLSRLHESATGTGGRSKIRGGATCDRAHTIEGQRVRVPSTEAAPLLANT